MSVVLKAENVAIRYITGDFKDIGIKEYTMRKLTGNYHVKEFMAVDGVSFELEQGDMLGIIGSNGAGKSTLLKAVAGIMEPTRGHITAKGDIAALLELASGFDGDLTVRENAYLRGAMLGYTREFMDKTYDQIVEFAELKDFEDRPFKQLSSGMKSRLAFSIASLVNPDILILDEVLSVGDGAFQEKSAKKMREILSSGTTTILVSHSLDQIRKLCNKVLWLDHGKQIAFGETQEICDQYERFMRGEYKIEEKQPTASDQKASEKVHSGARNKNDRRKVWVSRLIIAFFTACVLCSAASAIIGMTAVPTRLTLTAQPDSGKVTFRGGSVDGVWQSPTDIVVSQGNWIEDPVQVTYTAVDEVPLVIELPKGTERSLTFNAGPQEGTVKVESGKQTFTYDLYNESFVELGLPYDFAPAAQQTLPWYVTPVVTALLFLLLALIPHAPNLAREGFACDYNAENGAQEDAEKKRSDLDA